MAERPRCRLEVLSSVHNLDLKEQMTTPSVSVLGAAPMEKSMLVNLWLSWTTTGLLRIFASLSVCTSASPSALVSESPIWQIIQAG